MVAAATANGSLKLPIASLPSLQYKTFPYTGQQPFSQIVQENQINFAKGQVVKPGEQIQFRNVSTTRTTAQRGRQPVEISREQLASHFHLPR